MTSAREIANLNEVKEVNCRKCKLHHKDCPGKDFFDYGDIRFCEHQIIWLLGKIRVLHKGYWPQDPKSNESGYNIEIPKGKKARRFKSPFEAVSCILAELEYRLERIAEAPFNLRADGEMLEKCYIEGEPMWEVAMDQGINEAQARRRGERALAYIIGKRRKRRSYAEWVTHPKERGKEWIRG